MSAPSLAFLDRVVETHELVLVQTLRPKLAVEGLDDRVVGRLARAAKVERDVAGVRPQVQLARDELVALVDPDRRRIAHLAAHPFKHLHDVRRPEAEPRHDGRREPTEGVYNRQDAQLRPRRELVMDEVHGPNLIRTRRRAASFSQLRLHPTLRRFVSQLQPHFPVKPVYPLRIHVPALPAEQHMDAAIAVTHPRLGDLLHPLLQVGLIRATPTIVVARPLRPKHSTGPPDADLPCAPDGVDGLSAPVRPQSFRKTTSCNIALSRLRSATNRFSLAFSSLRWQLAPGLLPDSSAQRLASPRPSPNTEKGAQSGPAHMLPLCDT